MRIAINCRSFLTKQYTGIGRYAHQLVHSLKDIDSQNTYQLYIPKKIFDTKRKIPRILAKNFSLKVDRFSRGPEKFLKGIDLYHSPSPDVIRMKQAKFVVTIHDLVYKAFPEGHTEETLRLTDEQIHSFLPNVSKIICCSHHTASDLQRYFPVDKEKIRVVYQGVNKDVFYPLGEKERQFAQKWLRSKDITDPFLLFVGTIEPRKNLKNLLRAFSILKEKKIFNGKLVVIGMMGWKSGWLQDYLERLKITNDVIFLGFLSDDELRYFYNMAEVFVFPSFYEGFGYPIVEAFSCGAAVVASTASSCPEITNDAAVNIDPYDSESIEEALRKVLNDSELKADLKKNALLRSEHFSCMKTAQETLKVYEEVVHPRN